MELETWNLESWEEHLYHSTFSSIFNFILEEHRRGAFTVEELEINVNEQYQIMMNSSTEGAARFNYCSAMVDAHQYALALIKKGEI